VTIFIQSELVSPRDAADKRVSGMTVRVDQSRNDQLAAAIDDRLVGVPGLQLGGRSDIDDPVP
jgi:hypothetical protein